MTTTFTIKKNDTLPDLEFTALDEDGNAVDLTDATIVFNLADSNVSPFFSAAASIVDAVSGTMKYEWNGTTDNYVAGTYFGEFEVTFLSTKVRTFPNDNSLIIIVNKSFD